MQREPGVSLDKYCLTKHGGMSTKRERTPQNPV